MKHSEKLLKEVIESIEYGDITRNQSIEKLEEVLTAIGDEEETE